MRHVQHAIAPASQKSFCHSGWKSFKKSHYFAVKIQIFANKMSHIIFGAKIQMRLFAVIFKHCVFWLCNFIPDWLWDFFSRSKLFFWKHHLSVYFWCLSEPLLCKRLNWCWFRVKREFSNSNFEPRFLAFSSWLLILQRRQRVPKIPHIWGEKHECN